MPIPKKVEAIQALAVPKTCKQLRQFIGVIDFYRDMWQKRSELLAPLTALTFKNVKYDWKDEHQKCFDAITHHVGSISMYFKRSIEVRVAQQYFPSYHMLDSIKTLLVLVCPVIFDIFEC